MLTKPNLDKPVFLLCPQSRRCVERNLCPSCCYDIIESDFRDEISKKEYSISGFCQMCQDAVFDERGDGVDADVEILRRLS